MKTYFHCPLCGRRDTAALREREPPGEWGERFWIGCLKCETNMDGRAYLKALAEALGCRAIELLQKGDQVLADLLGDSGAADHRAGALKPLPEQADVIMSAERLQASNGPLKYLLRRGIKRSVLRRYQVGLNAGGRLTFPMRDEQERLVAYKTRPPTKHGQMRNIGGVGRAWPLYPNPWPNGRKPLIVCAGELDALCALSSGLDACSVTLGAGVWRHEWTASVFLRRVVIVFDNNEGHQARRLCADLLASGVSARAVDLHSLGMTDPKADLSDYLLSGRAANQLLEGR